MNKYHVYDPSFRAVSPTLKKILKKIDPSIRNVCVDVPSGNGRNIFYLAKYFKKTIAIDVNETYLSSIMSNCEKYNLDSITVSSVDLCKNIPDIISNADFISIIHFFEFSILNEIIRRTKKGAYLYIESPSCSGGNFLELPNESSLKFLLNGLNIIFIEKRICNQTRDSAYNISFKCLLKNE